MTIRNQPYTETGRARHAEVFGSEKKCLKCNGNFLSLGKGHRLCSKCRLKLSRQGSTVYFRPTGKKKVTK